MAKHDYKGRINDLNMTIDYLLDDFMKKYELKGGLLYRVIRDDGKYFDGFFRQLKVSIYGNKLDVWCSFYKMKKDGNPSKVDTGEHVTRIKDIIICPF